MLRSQEAGLVDRLDDLSLDESQALATQPEIRAGPSAHPRSAPLAPPAPSATVDKSSGHAYGATAGVMTKRAQMMALDPAVRRKCEATQVYFLDYYFDLLSYIKQRKGRFQKLKDDLRRVQVSQAQAQGAWRRYCSDESTYLRRRRIRTQEKEFHILAQIGQGGYGQVFLARKRDTSEICALKKMNKKLLQKLNEVQHILTERDILKASQTDWLVKLLYAFQDPEHVYLAMEYVPGGDVRTLLNSNGILLDKYTRFYIAEMCLAVVALHQLGYIHRDLKPENFLIDATGHVKLTDFGLSKGHLSTQRVEALRSKLEAVKNNQIIYRTSEEKRSFYRSLHREELTCAFSVVGSPDYMAPEIITNQGAGYDNRVDFWSIGCILYEFLSGYAPFTAPTLDEVWVNVYHWERVFEKPKFESQEAESNLTPEAWSLITQLITHRDQRLASLASLQQHPYFYGHLDLANMRTTVDPPFVPMLESEADTSYFDDFTNPEDMEIYKEVNHKKQQIEESMRTADPLPGTTAAADGSGNGSGAGDATADLGGATAGLKDDRAAFIGFTFRHRDFVPASTLR
ncbi:serine/threonine-protein kinase dbf2 [Tieghemiomyces parasiticus]|uniref:non-specific serine/threonine protein kinase n=1 Tax=Tieghemiomyces parasiticus TaxID=78921 RepID=A0A9W8E3Q1_9FUNG|nr:serine/threonine-protein kinase dbf2 [Tieghemiomyces parasiticus]